MLVLGIGASVGRWLLVSANDSTPAVLEALAHAADAPTHESGPPPRRVVIAVIDGLGEDAFASLVDRGALGPIAWRAHVDVGAPSLSRPVYHRLLTGVPQDVAGIRSNGHHGGARADSVAARVRDAHGRVAWALETVPWFADLFGDSMDAQLRSTAVTDPEALASLYRDGAQFILVHLVDVDEMGHAHGAASAEYRAAAERAMATLRTFRERVASEPDASRTVWFVGADHGHSASGGHGGPEWSVRRTLWVGFGAVATGAPFEVAGYVSADRLAPTFAAAVGIAPPREAMGESLPWPALGITAHGSAALSSRVRAVERAMSDARAIAHRLVALRFAAALGVLVAIGVLAARRGRGRELAGGALVLLAACVAVAIAGPGYTFTAIRTETTFVAHATVVLCIGALAAWPLARRVGARVVSTLALSALPPVLAFAASGGSVGRTQPPHLALVVLPGSGVVPIGVCCAMGLIALVRSSRRAQRTAD